jgi:hypothetical protein
MTIGRALRSEFSRAMAACAVAMVVAPLASCVSDGPARPAPRPQPANIAPNSLQMWVRTPLPDVDGNGFPDTLPVTVYLFAEGYDLAVDVPGTFRFELLSAEGRVARVWELNADEAKAAVRRAGPGPAYVFALSLLDGGSDRVRRQSVDLTATFTPLTTEQGPSPMPVRARTTTIQVGG